MSDDGRHLLAQVEHADQSGKVREAPVTPFIRVVSEIGEATATAGRTMLGLLGFLGATTIAFGNVIRHPSRFRFNAVVQRFEVVGVSALGIVGLMSFLIGIVIAQQGAVQLRQFGAEVFTINLVGRITLRELGVLMTAIMVAGRSGSAFAAQIGTMKLTEEIDAMRTIGVSPMEALVVPRTLAAMLLMPLLGFYASMIAIIGGGLLCWIALDIPPVTFVQRIREVVPITDLYVGLIKAPVFGAIIAIVGLLPGDAGRGRCRTGRAAHDRGRRPGDFPRHRARRVLRGLLHVDRLELMAAMNPIIRVRGLKNSFGEQVVHEDLDLDVRRGEILGVVGGSGTGKSVLMRSIIGLQMPDAGEIRCSANRRSTATRTRRSTIRKRWGVLFQGGALFSTLTVAENVQVPLREFYPAHEACS